MTPHLALRLEAGALERVSAQVAAVGFFSDERPLAGGAGRVDWRLCGQLSQVLMTDRVSGALGESILVPTFGRLRASQILAVGLGQRARFEADSARAVTAQVVRQGILLGADDLALWPLGIARDDFPRHAENVLSAAVEAVIAEAGQLQLHLCVPEEEQARILRALKDASRRIPVTDAVLSLP